jgi:UDP-N-acetyl-D-galactosamine dehydrogenase
MPEEPAAAQAKTWSSISFSGKATSLARELVRVYGRIVEAGLYRASSIEVAEVAKVIENTQRDINIALMNELAIHL